MPCQYETPEESLAIANKELSVLTKIACEMATVIKEHKLEHRLFNTTRVWIRQHEEEDRRRELETKQGQRKEKLKKAALKKLNKSERIALGL